jgi:hypothetical protein
VIRALGLVLSRGWRFVLAYLIVATAVETGRLFAAAGVDQLIGPSRPPTTWPGGRSPILRLAWCSLPSPSPSM